MTRKLLHRTLRSYLLVSVIILMVAAPLFYFVTERLYIQDADEALILRKNEFKRYSLKELKTSDIPIWNRMNRDVIIEPMTKQGMKERISYQFHFDTLNAENEPYRVLETPIRIENTPYVFSAKINLVETEDLIESILFLFAVTMSLLLVGLYLLTRRLSINLWKPFYTTLNQIEHFKIDGKEIPAFQGSQIEEFERLNQAILRLIERNKIIFDSQREFVENAAHELQTPLAVFQANIDTLVQDTHLTDEHARILEKLNENVSRMNRLNKNLLLLSKIDSIQYTNLEQVSLNEIFQKQSEFFEEQAKAKNIQITMDLMETNSVDANPVLVEILISNLFMNAIRHNLQNGSIQIELRRKSLTFYNTSESKPLNKERLFQRFSKANSSSEGNGLGLSIISKIANLYSWSVSYEYTENRHIFRVNF